MLLRPFLVPFILLLQLPIKFLNTIKREANLVKARLIVFAIIGLREKRKGTYYIFLSPSEDAKLTQYIILIKILMSLPLLLSLGCLEVSIIR